ncbi:MAG: hypothetical protein FWG25_01710 [Promicromonosporaceae bacterium]|nr:hypothetical protein [Promicromonosporaceae bacterium]
MSKSVSKMSKRNRIIGTAVASVLVIGGVTAGALTAGAAENGSTSGYSNGTTNGTTNGSSSSSSRSRGSSSSRTVVDPATVTVTQDQAEATAIAEVGAGATVDRATLRAGRGTDANPVWHVHVVLNDVATSVDVDAMTGTVVATVEGGSSSGSRSGSSRSRGSSSSRSAIDPATVTVSQDSAEATAISTIGTGATVDRATLRAGQGTDANPVWHIHLTDSTGAARSVDVDAMTGAVVTTDTSRTVSRGSSNGEAA